jgi:hypothetical protein
MSHKIRHLVFHSGEHVTNVTASHHGATAAAARKTGKPMSELVVLAWDQIGPDLDRAIFCAAVESAARDPNFFVPVTERDLRLA